MFGFFFWPRHAAYRILVPQPGIEPVAPVVGAWSPNHWTAREVLDFGYFTWFSSDSRAERIGSCY